MGRRARTANELDPRGVIGESYRMDGIGDAECRSIFLDWAIGIAPEAEPRQMIPELIALYGADAPDHPMTRVLTEGLETPPKPTRRGGRRGRGAG